MTTTQGRFPWLYENAVAAREAATSRRPLYQLAVGEGEELIAHGWAATNDLELFAAMLRAAT